MRALKRKCAPIRCVLTEAEEFTLFGVLIGNATQGFPEVSVNALKEKYPGIQKPWTPAAQECHSSVLVGDSFPSTLLPCYRPCSRKSFPNASEKTLLQWGRASAARP